MFPARRHIGFHTKPAACFNLLQQQPPFLAPSALPQLGGLGSSQESVVVVAPHLLPHHCRLLLALVYPLSLTVSP